MEVERDHAAPEREEPSAEVSRSDGEALGRVAPGRTGARGEPSLSWAPTDVAALQRTAGNAVVARMLARGSSSRAPVQGAARGVIQRDLTTKPKAVDAGKGSKELRDYLKGLKANMKAYKHGKGSDKLLLLPLMLASIKDWLEKYKANPGGKTGQESVENYKLQHQLEGLKVEIEREQQSAYFESVEHGGFEYASPESRPAAVGTKKLMTPGTPPSAAPGMGPKALKRIREAGLTEAETLAIKVYSVGDYRAINKTLQQLDILQQNPKTATRYDEELTNALHEMGLVKDERGSPVLPPWMFAGLFQQGTQQWTKQESLFKKYLPGFKPDLDKARREARQHAEMLKAAFGKMRIFDSRRRRKNTWRGVRLDPSWPVYKLYTTKDAVIDIDFFCSTSKAQKEAERFSKQKGQDGRKGFLLECVLKNGRDISMFSEHPTEEEVLVLPGAKLKVKSVLPPLDATTHDHYLVVEEQ